MKKTWIFLALFLLILSGCGSGAPEAETWPAGAANNSMHADRNAIQSDAASQQTEEPAMQVPANDDDFPAEAAAAENFFLFSRENNIATNDSIADT